MNFPDSVGIFPKFRFQDKFIQLLSKNLINEFEKTGKPDLVYVIASQLIHSDLQAAVIELPFLIMPLVMLWLGHPFAKW